MVERATLNRPYIRASIVTLCLSIGVAFTGVSRMFFPGVISSYSALQGLPTFALLYLNCAWIGAGLATAIAIAISRRRLEVIGLILLAGALSSYFVVFLILKTDNAPTAAYTLVLAFGLLKRAQYMVAGRQELYVRDEEA